MGVKCNGLARIAGGHGYIGAVAVGEFDPARRLRPLGIPTRLRCIVGIAVAPLVIRTALNVPAIERVSGTRKGVLTGSCRHAINNMGAGHRTGTTVRVIGYRKILFPLRVERDGFARITGGHGYIGAVAVGELDPAGRLRSLGIPASL